MSELNGCFIIPTGLGCAIGGDAGANTQVKLISQCCKNLIINPNAVNASDMNEMTDNCWYTEGSIIDNMLEGSIRLERPKTFNRILMVANPPLQPDNFNAMNASLHTLGADIKLVELNTPLTMRACLREDGTAGGEFFGADELIEQIKDMKFDVLAIHTPIECDEAVAKNYWENGGVNPWGGIEAIVSKYLATRLGKNLAHSPIEFQTTPEMLSLHHTKIAEVACAPEIISNTYAHCMFIGLHKAPRIVSNKGLGVEDIDFLVTPQGCWSRPHEACRQNNIPIIVVKENTTIFSEDFDYSSHEGLIFVENYLEAAGVLMSMNAGVDYRTVILKKD